MDPTDTNELTDSEQTPPSKPRYESMNGSGMNLAGWSRHPLQKRLEIVTQNSDYYLHTEKNFEIYYFIYVLGLWLKYQVHQYPRSIDHLIQSYCSRQGIDKPADYGQYISGPDWEKIQKQVGLDRKALEKEHRLAWRPIRVWLRAAPEIKNRKIKDYEAYYKKFSKADGSDIRERYFVYILKFWLSNGPDDPEQYPKSINNVLLPFCDQKPVPVPRPAEFETYTSGQAWERIKQRLADKGVRVQGLEEFDPKSRWVLFREWMSEYWSSHPKKKVRPEIAPQSDKTFQPGTVLAIWFFLVNVLFGGLWTYVVTHERPVDITPPPGGPERFSFEAPPYGPAFVELEPPAQIRLSKQGDLVDYDVYALSERPVTRDEVRYIVFDDTGPERSSSDLKGTDILSKQKSSTFCRRLLNIWKFRHYESFDRADSDNERLATGRLIPIYEGDVGTGNTLVRNMLRKGRTEVAADEVFWLAFARPR